MVISCSKKAITLKDAIKEELKDDEFAIYFEKEKVINAIARTIVEMRQNGTKDFNSF
jgi:hypothetical protein